MVSKIDIALITHAGSQYDPRPELHSLCNHLRTFLKADLLVISEQNIKVPTATEYVHTRLQFYRALSALYLIRGRSNYYLRLSSLALRVLCDGVRSLSYRPRRHQGIERALYRKHFQAWLGFYESGADYLIVFEDDVLFPVKAEEKVTSVLNTLRLEAVAEDMVYLNLGQGFSGEWLATFTGDSDNGHALLRSAPGEVTNTCCCYLISRGLAEKLIIDGDLSMTNRFIPVDFFLELFLNNQRSSATLLRCVPPLFGHGSVITGISRLR